MTRRDDLEIQLVRSSVGALSAQRYRCSDCGRTPLTGERVYRYEGGRAVCELCRALHREQPVGSEPVRDEAGPYVRVRSRAA
jgi:hypothetical protein